MNTKETPNNPGGGGNTPNNPGGGGNTPRTPSGNTPNDPGNPPPNTPEVPGSGRGATKTADQSAMKLYGILFALSALSLGSLSFKNFIFKKREF